MHSLSVVEKSWRCLAISLFVVYVSWQAFWIAGGSIPPALLVGLTGLPAPTTGGTRSLMALLAGDWRLSFYHNPMTLPIIIVLMMTLTWLIKNIPQLRTKSLPRPIVYAWVVILGLAWVIKLAQAACGYW